MNITVNGTIVPPGGTFELGGGTYTYIDGDLETLRLRDRVGEFTLDVRPPPKPIIEIDERHVMVLCPRRHLITAIPQSEWAGSREEARYTDPTATVTCTACTS